MKIAAISIADVREMSLATCSHLAASCEGRDDIDVPATNGYEELLMNLNDARLVQAKMRRMIEATLRIFQNDFLECHMASMVEFDIIGLYKTHAQQSAREEKTNVYEAFQRVVHRAVTRGAVNEGMHNDIDGPPKLQNFVRHLTWNGFEVRLIQFLARIIRSSMCRLALPSLPGFLMKRRLLPEEKGKSLHGRVCLSSLQSHHISCSRKMKGPRSSTYFLHLVCLRNRQY